MLIKALMEALKLNELEAKACTGYMTLMMYLAQSSLHQAFCFVAGRKWLPVRGTCESGNMYFSYWK